MEIDVIVERLRGIESTLERIEDHRLHSIEEHLKVLNGRLAKCENWQAATDPVLDSQNERIDEVTDVAERNKTWIEQQSGWNSGRTQMIVQIGMLISILATLLKVFHG